MRILYFFIISLISLASCQQAPMLLPELKVADSLVWEQPDSALAILTQMPKPSPSDRLNDATWCLLYTQARDKCYLPHASDSLINVAVRYFECRDDWRRKAQAWFYRGQVELDRKNIKEAVAYYVKAKGATEHFDDPLLCSLIYRTFGVACRYQKMYDVALDNLGIALLYAQKTGQTPELCNVYSDLGRTFAHLGQKDSTLFYFLHSWEVARLINNKRYIANALKNISVFYREDEQYALALQYELNALNVRIEMDDSLNISQSYYGLGGIYYYMNMLDSAKYYFEKSLQTDNLYRLYGANTMLSEIAMTMNNCSEARQYHLQADFYKDSISKIASAKELTEVQSKYDYEKLKSEKIQSENKSLWRFIVCILVILILLVKYIVVLRQRNNNKVRYERRIKELEEQKEDNDRLIKQKEEELRNGLNSKDCDVAAAQDTILSLQAQNEKLQAEILQHRRNLLLSEKQASLIQSQTKLIQKLQKRECEIMQYIHQNMDFFRKLLSQTHVIRDYAPIVQQADWIYPGFSVRLRKAFPDLKNDDINLCCLIKLRVPLVQIAELESVQKATIIKRKQRLFSRMKCMDAQKCEPFENLDAFIEDW